MRGDEGVLSNSIAFMTHPQEGKEIYYKFLLRKKREGKEKEKKKKKERPMLSGVLILKSNQALKTNNSKNLLLLSL